jgi:hypothetical protein
MSSAKGHYATVQWLLEKGGANIGITNARGQTIWSQLMLEGAADADTELSSLVKTMVLLADAPANFIAKLSPKKAELAARGRQLRAVLPVYMEQQRAFVRAHCPLIAALQRIVAAYAAPTSEDIWMDGACRLQGGSPDLLAGY